jgi:hypothetical protein
MAKPIGNATCPECGHNETVMSDGRKFYIKCGAESCRTFTNYQAKPAKARIQKRLTGLGPEPESEPVKKPDPPPKQPEKTEVTTKRSSSFFDSLEDIF